MMDGVRYKLESLSLDPTDEGQVDSLVAIVDAGEEKEGLGMCCCYSLSYIDGKGGVCFGLETMDFVLGRSVVGESGDGYSSPPFVFILRGITVASRRFVAMDWGGCGCMQCHAQLSSTFYERTCPTALTTIRTSI
ncbi:hypothetical protein RDI58_027008 [Solanum bulbocastanum]|uniref:Uncharacterized protein n=1 Tax=Solanum bulbocastanum TaxID=147425 RepID=A0AAN8Y1Z3_SOLBU